MSNKFTFHDVESAPKKSKALLKELLEQSGPNGFYSVLAESPEALLGYNALNRAFSETTFTNEEKTVVWQTINVENQCRFCVPAHTKMAKMMNVKEEINNALRNATKLDNTKLEALREFTLVLLRKKGHASSKEIENFLEVGYTRQNILEIILALAEKTISNYVNHLAKPKLDPQYEKYAWGKDKSSEL